MPKRPALTNIDRLRLFGSIAGFPLPSAPLRSSDRRQSFAGTVLAFGPTGAGDRATALADRKLSRVTCPHSRDEPGNPLWGSPRIHGELLKLGFDVAQSTVAKYMVRRLGPPSQGWKTFLHNHVPHIGAIDMFVVPTVGFRLLYGLVILRLNHAAWSGSTSPPIPRPTGSPARSLKLSPGIRRPVSHSRPRRLIWPSRNATSCCHGHPGPTNGAAIALAKWPCRTAHRFHTARVPGPCRGPGRRAPAPDPEHVCRLLQRTENPPFPGQRLPAPSRR